MPAKPASVHRKDAAVATIAHVGGKDIKPPNEAEIRRHLRAKNLACWCKPGDPCHADTLLEIANA